MSAEEYLLVLNAPPALGDTIADWLLQDDTCQGFTSMPVNGYSRNTAHYSLAEQVTGREKRVAFQIQGEADTLRSILEGIREQFGGTHLHYWILPVIEAGTV